MSGWRSNKTRSDNKIVAANESMQFLAERLAQEPTSNQNNAQGREGRLTEFEPILNRL
jgi:hypothetical protein